MARRCFLFSVPITLIFAERTLPVYKEVTNWLAKQLNIERCWYRVDMASTTIVPRFSPTSFGGP